MDKNLLILELLENIRRNERELMKSDDSSISDVQSETTVEGAYDYQLLCKTANSLEFLVTAVPAIYDNATGQTTVQSLMEQKETLECLRCLSNDMDKQFIQTLYCENFPVTASATLTEVNSRQEIATAVQDKLDLLMDIAPFAKAYAEHCQEAASPVTIADLEQSVNTTEALMAQYDIQETNITNKTMQVVGEKYQHKELYVIEDRATREEEIAKEADNLVIVESNDGYVMATNASPELFRENPSLEREFSARVQNGNEIIHNEAPKETTIDFSKVGGNVRYEQFDDIGTVEKEQGVPTYEEKAEMSERTERETSGDGKSCTTTTTKTTKTEAYER